MLSLCCCLPLNQLHSMYIAPKVRQVHVLISLQPQRLVCRKELRTQTVLASHQPMLSIVMFFEKPAYRKSPECFH